MTMEEYHYKRRKKPDHIYFESHYFDKKTTAKLTDFSIEQLHYLRNIGLVKPFISIQGFNSFYNYQQLVELKALKRFYEDFKIPKTRLKIAKNVLQEIDSAKDLSDKNILIAYGELYFINKNDLDEKLISLSNTNKGQYTLIKHFALSELENEIDEKAKVYDIKDYEFRKNSKFNIA